MNRYSIQGPVTTPLKIAHLTDIHTGGIGHRERKMLAILEQEKPDVIVVTGDTISSLHAITSIAANFTKSCMLHWACGWCWAIGKMNGPRSASILFMKPRACICW